MFTVKYDPLYNEPKPKKWIMIRCFDCNRELLNKSECRNHMGHEVRYCDAKGNPTDG